MSKKQPLVNAGKIIERFGGIRPMAAKIETPVTTVQGWKKRDVIPGTRRTQILSAASENNIDISDLATSTASNENTSAKTTKSKTVKKSESKKKTSYASKKKTVKSATSKTKAKTKKTDKIASVSVPKASSKTLSAQKKEDSQLAHDNVKLSAGRPDEMSHKAVGISAWVATGLILLAIASGALLLWPHLKKNNQRIQEQNEQLVTLQDKVEEVSVQKEEVNEKFLGTSLPDNIQEKIDGLQNQARNISVTVDQLSKKAQEISETALGENAQGISQRLKVLEAKIEDLSGPEGSFAGLVSRIRDLEDSVGGKTQIKNSANQLRSMINKPAGTIGQNLAAAQNSAQGALGRTLEGVPGEDLKAAAILIAFSQFRSSLEREQPFEKDLALLQELIGDKNPKLQRNLQRLSVHANGGVLTTSGLASELKRMTGDIVVSSLKGEDVSIKEKAKARFGSLVQIEKDGEILSGTQTQATVAKAQDYIEKGQIEDGISALEGLNGSAAVAVQPFIQKAKGSMLAEKVKAMLNESILSKVENVPSSPSLSSSKLEEMQNKLERSSPFQNNSK